MHHTKSQSNIFIFAIGNIPYQSEQEIYQANPKKNPRKFSSKLELGSAFYSSRGYRDHLHLSRYVFAVPMLLCISCAFAEVAVAMLCLSITNYVVVRVTVVTSVVYSQCLCCTFGRMAQQIHSDNIAIRFWCDRKLLLNYYLLQMTAIKQYYWICFFAVLSLCFRKPSGTGPLFSDHTCKYIFVTQNLGILIEISLTTISAANWQYIFSVIILTYDTIWCHYPQVD